MKYWIRAFLTTLLIVLPLFAIITVIQQSYIDKYIRNDSPKQIMKALAQQATMEADCLSKSLYDYYVGVEQSETGYFEGVSQDKADIEEKLKYWRESVGPEEMAILIRNYRMTAEYWDFIQDYYYREMLEKYKTSSSGRLYYYLRLYKEKEPNENDNLSGNSVFEEYFKDDLLQIIDLDLESLKDGKTKSFEGKTEGTVACVMKSLQYCDNFKLVLIQPIDDMDLMWYHAKDVITIITIIAAVLVVIIILLSMWEMSKPVTDLAKATRKYAQGDRSQKLDPIGWDEVAELARLFNSMADETQRLELVEEDAERKQRFLDSFTHELRTPLTNIHGYSELMKRVQLTEEDRLRYLDYVMHESRRLNRLSEELFGLTVLRENTTRMERVSCGRLLDFAEQTLREKARKKDVRLVCEQSDCTVYGSKALLESLCTNLCENAIRACAEGDEVRVSFREEEDGAVLRVADTGRGIAPEDLAHITEPFYRVDKARSRAEGGVGLGLYLCSEIVRIHGAAMAFDSKEGEGTTVTVRFPRQEQN